MKNLILLGRRTSEDPMQSGQIQHSHAFRNDTCHSWALRAASGLSGAPSE